MNCIIHIFIFHFSNLTCFLNIISPARFGNAMSPLKMSDISHTVSSLEYAPMTTQKAKIILKNGITRSPKIYFTQHSPQKYQLISVANAKSTIETDVNIWEKSPIILPNASAASETPVFPDERLPVVMIASAVRVQHIIVSVNTSNTAHSP